MLRSWSEVWAAALEDKKETILDLTAHDPVIVEMCAVHCYTGTINIDDNNNFVLRALCLLTRYDLRDLMTACDQLLLSTPQRG